MLEGNWRIQRCDECGVQWNIETIDRCASCKPWTQAEEDEHQQFEKVHPSTIYFLKDQIRAMASGGQSRPPGRGWSIQTLTKPRGS